MASLRIREGVYTVLFRWGGRQVTRSLHTKSRKQAENLRGRLEEQIDTVRRGSASIPPNADPIEWLLSAGQRTGPAEGPTDAVRTLGELLDRYRDVNSNESLAATTRTTERIHHGHLKRELGALTPIQTIREESLQRYVTGREREVAPATVRKELSTLRAAWRWMHDAGVAPPPPKFAKLKHSKTAEPPPFRHAEEIRAMLKSDPDADAATLWESLVLTIDEVKAVVAYVREHWSRHPWFVDAWTIAAYTGARRSELCRMRAEDVDLKRGELTLRDKKRVTDRSEGRRVVQIAAAILPTLKRLKARGGALIRHSNHRDMRLAKSLTDQWDDEAHPPDSPWKHVRGFHVLRHSFASNLAAAGVSQSLIDSWMGHQTEEMRKRYRHFFPAEKQRAIEALG
nr:tyrosine recombinase XerC [uncultured bacterium]